MRNYGVAVMFVAALVLATAAAGRSVAAQVGATPPGVEQRLGFDVGIASAGGMAGLTYQVAPVRWFRAEAGVGYGATGTQLSFMNKVAFGGATCRFVGGVGASLSVGGAHVEPGHGPAPNMIPWVNVDVLGGECRTANGFSIQAALGATTPLTAFHWDFADLGDTVRKGELMPQGRFGLGWWF